MLIKVAHPHPIKLSARKCTKYSMIILTKGVNKRQLRYASLILICAFGSDNYTTTTLIAPRRNWRDP